jgi:hypothetical protein
VQDIPNEQNSKVVDQGQVTETGKPVPQEAATPQRPIFKIFFTIYVNMYSMEFFFDQWSQWYLLKKIWQEDSSGILQLCWNFSMNCSTASTPPFCSPQSANLWNAQLQKPQIIYNIEEKPESHYGTCILKTKGVQERGSTLLETLDF